jgi:hypothetical protein
VLTDSLLYMVVHFVAGQLDLLSRAVASESFCMHLYWFVVAAQSFAICSGLIVYA